MLPKPRYGADNPQWRGGRTVTEHGYVLVRVGRGHHLADVRGYAYEHRVVAEQKLGRRLRKGEQVHHIDGNRENNAPANLEVCTHPEHGLRHRCRDSQLRRPGEPNPLVRCGCGCGVEFRRYDKHGRPRTVRSGHNGRKDVGHG